MPPARNCTYTPMIPDTAIMHGDSMDASLIRDFVSSASAEASVTGEDGLKALAVAVAAYRSSASHRTIALSEL